MSEASSDANAPESRPSPIAPVPRQRSNGRTYYICDPIPDSDAYEWDEEVAKVVEAERARSRVGTGMDKKNWLRYKEDVATKQRLLRMREVVAMLRTRGDARDAQTLTEISLKEVRKFVKLEQRYDRRFNFAVLLPLVIAMILTSASGPCLVSIWVGSGLTWTALSYGFINVGLLLSMGVVLLILFIDIEDIHVPGWTTLLFCLLILLAGLVAAALVAFSYRAREPGKVIKFAAGLGTSALLLAFSITIAALILNQFIFLGQRGLAPEILLLIDLVDLVASSRAWCNASNEADMDSKRVTLLAELDTAARRVERSFARLVRRSKDAYLHAWAAERGRQIGAVIRKHKEKVLEVPVADRESISASLLNGVQFIVRSDWKSLLVVEPEAPAKSFIRRAAPRLGLTSLLVALAIVLPALLPAVIKDVPTFQASVLVAAGFALLAPDVPRAAEAVRQSLVKRAD